MEKNNRLIDANALLEEIERIYTEHYEKSAYKFIHDFFRAIIRRVRIAPTVDAVEVVRCKDCKHCKKYRNKLDPMLNHQLCVRLDTYGWGVDEDDFCSYGERKEN